MFLYRYFVSITDVENPMKSHRPEWIGLDLIQKSESVIGGAGGA